MIGADSVSGATSWPDVALLALNIFQALALAFVAQCHAEARRHRRRRRADRRPPGTYMRSGRSGTTPEDDTGGITRFHRK